MAFYFVTAVQTQILSCQPSLPTLPGAGDALARLANPGLGLAAAGGDGRHWLWTNSASGHEPVGPEAEFGLSPVDRLLAQAQHQIEQWQTHMLSLLSGLMGTGHPPGSSPQHRNPSHPNGKSEFNVASFNVLGASHTAAGGNKPGMRSGEDRMRGAVQALQRHNIDVAGLQEFQGPQQRAFRKLAPNYGVAAEKDNAVVWNQDKFRLVEKRSVTIPYFEGHPRKMPVVQLEDRRTGQKMWVADFHNPADTRDHPHNAANRGRAIAREQQLARQLRATGLPVLFLGDFNERRTVGSDLGQAGLSSARPGRARREIDWVLGSSGVDFSDYLADHSTVSSGTSDHPLVMSTVTL